MRTPGSSIVKHEVAARFNGFFPVLIILEYSPVGMIAVHKNQIIKIQPGFAIMRIADEQMNFMREPAFFESNLKELIVLWRDVN